MPNYGKRRVRFVPIRDGDEIALGDTLPPSGSYYATNARHLLVGFKPGPGPKASGWLVVLVDESAKPKTHQPRKIRSVAS
jgi:hypothetical protein